MCTIYRVVHLIVDLGREELDVEFSIVSPTLPDGNSAEVAWQVGMMVAQRSQSQTNPKPRSAIRWVTLYLHDLC